MDAVEFLKNWFFPILLMVTIGIIIIGWLIALAIYGYKLWKK